ncbi:Protein of unknown function [Cotesia congregata]|uniref:Uncharacterized protein n=1 Tax=Cotesia congregata TaxID=51543 RepID=A0A8J2E8L1_COTCN|nr:Protein of unknown function [Cotesia congregata]
MENDSDGGVEESRSTNKRTTKSREEKEDNGARNQDDLSSTDVDGGGGDNRSLMRILSTLSREVKTMKRIQLQMEERHDNQPPPPNARVWTFSLSIANAHSKNFFVEIGRAGSNVFVSRDQWKTANSRANYSSMGVALFQALFETYVMLRSNLRGGSSKIDKNQPRRFALDQAIITTITGNNLEEFICPQRRKTQLGWEKPP